MNGFSAADMTTAAANGFRDGYQAGYADAVKAFDAAQPAAAQEAVAWMTHHAEPMLFPTREEASDYCNEDEQPIALYAAPVAAAQAIPNGKLVGWWNGITPDITERSPYGPSVRWGANAEDRAHDIPLYDGYNPVHYQQPTPAAPGIDRDQLGDLLEGMTVSIDVDGLFNTDGRRLFGTVTSVQYDGDEKCGLTLLVQDAEPNWEDSPKGGSDDARARFEAWATAYGFMPLGLLTEKPLQYSNTKTAFAWMAWQAAMQATSAEVGS